MSNRLRQSKPRTQQNLKTLAILGASACYLCLLHTPALAQDWKPGDPIPFGAAHKSMFDTSAPAGVPGASRVLAPGTASGAQSSAGASPAMNPATSAAASAQPSAMDNFLNSRSIEWKPGDPVSFGAAHHPAANDKSINGDINQSLNGAMPSTPISTPIASPGGLQGIPAGMPGSPGAAGPTGTLSQPTLPGFSPAQPQSPSPAPSPVIGAANSPLQDLAPAPTTFGASSGVGSIPAGMPSNIPGWAPVTPGGTGFSGATGPGNILPPGNSNGKKNKANKNSTNKQTDSQQKQKSKSKNKNKAIANDMQNSQQMNQPPASGGIFSHAFHWMFGGN
jgi:hypothetical protein